MRITLILQADLRCSHVLHRRVLVNKLCISIHCRKREISYDVGSSLKEPGRTAASKIEAGNLRDNPRRLGKGRVRLVDPAPLEPDRKIRRRQYSPVPLARSRVPVTRKTELGGAER